MVSLQKKTVDEINSKYARDSNRTLSIMMDHEDCSTIHGMLVFKYWYYKYNDQILHVRLFKSIAFNRDEAFVYQTTYKVIIMEYYLCNGY